MTFIKRGLGRGLEVLLADKSNLAGIEQPVSAASEMEDQLVVAQNLINKLQKENKILLSEIESLKNLLDELDSILRADTH